MPMAKSRFRFVNRQDAIVACPRCEGRGVIDYGNFGTRNCLLCRGFGRIPFTKCICGRPLLLTKTGQVEGTLYSCGEERCKRQIKHLPETEEEAAQKRQVTTGVGFMGFPRGAFSPDDNEAEDALAQMKAEAFFGWGSE